MKKIILSMLLLATLAVAKGGEFGVGALLQTTDWSTYSTYNAVVKYKKTKWEFPGEGIAGEYLLLEPEIGSGFSAYLGLGLEYHWRTVLGFSGRVSGGIVWAPLSFMDLFLEAVPKFNVITSSGGVDYNLGLRFYF